jgi:hypothetical protein
MQYEKRPYKFCLISFYVPLVHTQLGNQEGETVLLPKLAAKYNYKQHSINYPNINHPTYLFTYSMEQSPP